MVRPLSLVLIAAIGVLGESAFGQTPILSKEYTYLGDRVIAVESGADGTSPTSLVAATSGTTQINLTWAAPSLGSHHHYGIWRLSAGSAWTRVGTAPSTSTSYPDTGLNSAATYVYKVAAENSSDQVLAYSNLDLATTILFTDDPLTEQSTVVKEVHVTQLRTAVNAVRATAGLSAASWTNGSLTGAWVHAVDVTELRSRLNEAISALGLSVPTYTDSTLTGVAIKKVHLDQLRQRVK